MASILDDLKGILSPEDFAKLESNSTMTNRLKQGENLFEWYLSGEGENPPVFTSETNEPARAVTPPPARGTDLQDIERMLDTRIGTLNQTIETKINELVTSRGNELVNNAVKISMARADELNRLYMRHSDVTGKPLDSKAFNEFLEKEENKGRFRTITEAGEAFLAPSVREKDIATEVEKRVKAAPVTSIPGTTPSPSANSNIRFFKSRTVAGDGARETGAARAAALLDRKMAEAQSA